MVVDWSTTLALITLIAVVVGAVWRRDRALVALIRAGDSELHTRIDDTRDNYVRRDDLNGHIARIEEALSAIQHSMEAERRDTNKRLDAVLLAVKSA